MHNSEPFVLAPAGWSLKSAINKSAAVAMALFGVISTSWASPIVTVPPGLIPGTQYRIVVVTGHLYDATSNDINLYNTEVNNEINNLIGNTGSLLARLGATWEAIVSTEGNSQGNDYGADSAIVNIGQNPDVAIYNVQGLKVANDTSNNPGGLFAGGFSSLFANITPVVSLDPANPHDYFAWTGTNRNGLPTDQFSQANGFPLGHDANFQGFPGARSSVGQLDDPGSGFTPTRYGAWIESGPFNYDTTYPLHLYAISTVLTVQASAVPEPATGLLLGGFMLMGIAARKRKMAPTSRP